MTPSATLRLLARTPSLCALQHLYWLWPIMSGISGYFTPHHIKRYCLHSHALIMTTSVMDFVFQKCFYSSLGMKKWHVFHMLTCPNDILCENYKNIYIFNAVKLLRSHILILFDAMQKPGSWLSLSTPRSCLLPLSVSLLIWTNWSIPFLYLSISAWTVVFKAEFVLGSFERSRPRGALQEAVKT